jgi:hypothetical protein
MSTLRILSESGTTGKLVEAKFEMIYSAPKSIPMNIYLQTQVATPSEGSKVEPKSTIPLQSHIVCRSI